MSAPSQSISQVQYSPSPSFMIGYSSTATTHWETNPYHQVPALGYSTYNPPSTMAQYSQSTGFLPSYPPISTTTTYWGTNPYYQVPALTAPPTMAQYSQSSDFLPSYSPISTATTYSGTNLYPQIPATTTTVPQSQNQYGLLTQSRRHSTSGASLTSVRP